MRTVGILAFFVLVISPESPGKFSVCTQLQWFSRQNALPIPMLDASITQDFSNSVIVTYITTSRIFMYVVVFLLTKPISFELGFYICSYVLITI